MEHLLRCLAHFLGGLVLYTDPINALIVFISICATNEGGFARTQLLLVSILFAVAVGMAWGVLGFIALSHRPARGGRPAEGVAGRAEVRVRQMKKLSWVLGRFFMSL